MSDRFWLIDAQWAVIELLLPQLDGKPRVDDRRVISGILHRYREGLRWRTIPAEYGPCTTLFNRFNRWSQKGIWQALLAALAACEGPAGNSDGRKHRSPRPLLGGRRKKGQLRQAIGRSRGGPTTKIHALADGAGRLYALLLSAGQVHDIHGGRALLASMPVKGRILGSEPIAVTTEPLIQACPGGSGACRSCFG